MGGRILLGKLPDGTFRLRAVMAGGNINSPNFSELVFDSEYSTVRVLQSGSAAINKDAVVEVPLAHPDGYVPFVFASVVATTGFAYYGTNNGDGSGNGPNGSLDQPFVMVGTTSTARTNPAVNIGANPLCFMPSCALDDGPISGSIFGPNPYWDPFKRGILTVDITTASIFFHFPMMTNGGPHAVYYHVLAVRM